MATTSMEYVNYADWLKRMARKNGGTWRRTLINATEGGLRVPGIMEIPLGAVLGGLQKTDGRGAVARLYEHIDKNKPTEADKKRVEDLKLQMWNDVKLTRDLAEKAKGHHTPEADIRMRNAQRRTLLLNAFLAKSFQYIHGDRTLGTLDKAAAYHKAIIEGCNKMLFMMAQYERE